MNDEAQKIESVYALARRHGLSHKAALDCVAAGEVKCWCGNPKVCEGGAQRFVGCPLSMRADSSIPLNFTHLAAFVFVLLAAAAMFAGAARAQLVDESDAVCSYENLSRTIVAGPHRQQCDWDGATGGFKWRWVQ